LRFISIVDIVFIAGHGAREETIMERIRLYAAHAFNASTSARLALTADTDSTNKPTRNSKRQTM